MFFTIIAMLAMPLIMVVIAPGFVGDKETFDLAVALTRIAFPYLLFMSLTALQSGVLNSLNRFTAAAAAPILLNLALIGSNLVALALGTGNTPATGHILAWGIFVAGLLAVHAAGGGVPAGRHAAGAALAAPDAGREAGHPAVGRRGSCRAASCRSICSSPP